VGGWGGEKGQGSRGQVVLDEEGKVLFLTEAQKQRPGLLKGVWRAGEFLLVVSRVEGALQGLDTGRGMPGV
jgi:hypothetical protein